jgi:hypothetical protein
VGGATSGDGVVGLQHGVEVDDGWVLHVNI